MSLPPAEPVERNIRHYPIYAFFYNAFFWMPVFFLFFGERLPLAQVLQLEGIYYVAVVLLEVPSGYFSDRVGRKLTLVLSSVFLVTSYALFFASTGFAGFALAQVLLAGGIAFNSGTDTSFHYDSLVAAGREAEYEEREAMVAHRSLLAMASSALVGGLVASIDLRFAYGLSLVTALCTLAIAVGFREPDRAGAAPAAEFVRQIGNCLGHLRQPSLRWLFAFAVLAVVLNHVPYEFYQPYLGVLGAGLDLGDHTATAAGVHAAVATLVAAAVARRSARIDARLGTVRTLLLAAGIQIAIIAAMGAVLHVAIVALVLLREVPDALSRAPLNAAVTPKIPRQERATYLSIQSLAGRLSFSALLLGLSGLAGEAEIGGWSAISALLLASAAVGVAGWSLLLATRRGVA